MLIISGSPTEQALQSAWDDIYSEYLQLIGDNQALEMLFQLSLLQAVRSKIYRVKLFVVALSNSYETEFVKILQDEGYPYEYKNDNTMEGDLKKTLTRLVQDELEEADLAGIIEDRQGEDRNEKISSNYFREALAQCSDTLRFHIPYTKDLMTADFCAYIKQAKSKAEQRQPQEEYYG